MSKLIKFTMVGGGPNNPSATTSYNPSGGLTAPFYINIDRIRGVNYVATGNYPTLKVFIQGGGSGFSSITPQSEILKIYGISNGDATQRAEIGQKAVEAFVGVLENTNQDSNIIEFPLVEGFNAKAGECLSLEIAFNV